jgi:acrylyl-CoA reductase (NADPH)
MMTGTSGLTAAMGAEKILMFNIKPGDGNVLVTGATGAVGSFGVALLSTLGYRVIAATGKGDQAGFLNTLGAAEVISREVVMAIPEKPLLSSRWVAALDTVGGDMLDAVIRQTSHNGVVACCGNVAGNDFSTSVLPFILRGISLMGIDSGIALMNDRLRIWNRLAADWKPASLKNLCKEVNLDGLPAEIENMIKGKQTGKVLVNLVAG